MAEEDPPSSAPPVASSGRRTAVWGAADQIVYGASNLALSLLVATSVSSSEFGAFSLVLALSTVSLGASQAFCSEVLTVVFGAEGPVDLRNATSRAAGCALALGGIATVASGAVASITDGPVGPALGAFAIAAPVLFVQDVWRFSLFAQRRPQAALINDLTWGVVQLATVLVLKSTGIQSVAAFVMAWAGGAAASAVLGAAQCRTLPSPSQALDWARVHRHLGLRFTGEFLSLFGGYQALVFVVGAVAGLAEVGRLRAALLLFVPAQAAVNAARLVATSAAVRALDEGTTRLARLRRQMMIGLTVISVGSSLAASVIPDPVGSRLLGESWEGLRPVIVLLALSTVAATVTLPSVIVLRALQEARLSFRARLVGAGSTFALGVGGTIATRSAVGAAAGLALGASIGAIVVARAGRRALARREGQAAVGAIIRELPGVHVPRT